MVHVEFVVPGPPISNQSQGTNLQAWRAAVQARKLWKAAPLLGNLKGIIINFHEGDKPSLDVDNMSKPILDAMQAIVYVDDRQVRQCEITHVRIDAPFVFAGASKAVVSAVQAAQQFVYVRIEDAVNPFPLPK